VFFFNFSTYVVNKHLNKVNSLLFDPPCRSTVAAAAAAAAAAEDGGLREIDDASGT